MVTYAGSVGNFPAEVASDRNGNGSAMSGDHGVNETRGKQVKVYLH
jgi:hypothetical protein